MAKEKAPSFPFYTRDWLADEHTITMNCTARGAYINLLCVCWNEGSLPSRDPVLVKLANATQREWRQVKAQVMACFVIDETSRYRHERLDLERAKQAAYRETQAAKGRASVQQRFNHGSTTVQPKGEPDINLSSSSSFSIAVPPVQNTGGTPARRAVHGDGPFAGSLPKDHLKCAFPCGRVCFPAALKGEFVRLHNTPDSTAYVTAWHEGINRAWGPDGAHERDPTGADKFAFWRARWDEDHPAVKRGKGGEDAVTRIIRELGSQ